MTPARDLPAEGTRQNQTLELTPKVPLGPANWTNRTNKLNRPPPKKDGEGKLGWLVCTLEEPPAELERAKICLQLHPFQAGELWEAASPSGRSDLAALAGLKICTPPT